MIGEHEPRINGFLYEKFTQFCASFKTLRLLIDIRFYKTGSVKSVLILKTVL
jgi:hypothetical protein